MTAKDYKDLIAGRKAFGLALMIYRETSDFPSEEKYGLISQLRRAAISIPSNIAEGEGRNAKDFQRYLFIALGSLKELETQILISDALGYLGKGKAILLMEKASEIGRLMHGLSRSLIKQ